MRGSKEIIIKVNLQTILSFESFMYSEGVQEQIQAGLYAPIIEAAEYYVDSMRHEPERYGLIGEMPENIWDDIPDYSRIIFN